MTEKEIMNHLPLTEATYFILASMRSPIHGYRIMQQVEVLSQGTVRVGAGTLYGVLSSLEKGKLIRMVAEEERRKIYQITSVGLQVLEKQKERYEIMVSAFHFQQ
jgi:DNA-binding PadR family transcriptional regulator